MSLTTGSMLAIGAATSLAGQGIQSVSQSLQKAFTWDDPNNEAKHPKLAKENIATNSTSAGSLNLAKSSKASDLETLQKRILAHLQQARQYAQQQGLNSQEPMSLYLREGEGLRVESEDIAFSQAIESWIADHPEAGQDLQSLVASLSGNADIPWGPAVASPRDTRRGMLEVVSTPQSLGWQWRS